MTKIMAMALGILVTTLTMAGVGQAQNAVTIQGTIQSVDCTTKFLVVKTAGGTQDSTYVLPAGSSTTVFVNSNPVDFCTLQQYIGSNVTVSVVPNGNQLMITRVDVSATAASTSNQPALITGMPGWAKIALGLALVAALVYFGSQKHDAPPQQPYYQCPDGSWRPSCP